MKPGIGASQDSFFSEFENSRNLNLFRISDFGFRISNVLLLLFFAALLLFSSPAPASEPTREWHPATAPLMTRWAAQVSPTNVHPEYPRPQLVRPDWLNLNGLWDYAIRPLTAEVPAHYDGKLLVPFALEAALSGVGKPLDDQSALWYRRTVTIPPGWKGRRVRLQFGAVDWQCKLMVNGREIGSHRGGFERFGFDITDQLHWERDEEIVLRVTDPTEGDQPRGKQSHHPEGIFYSSSSGIWQTVWLEPVPQVCIDELTMTPELDAKGLRLRVAVNSLSEDLFVEAVARSRGEQVAQVRGHANTELFLPISNPSLWSPDTPFLYELEVRLVQADREQDRVSSYFAMRKVSLVQDKHGFTRIALNGQPLFQVGTLDQGFWPDGIYTAPTDAALQSDIIFLKSAGFNLARKHVKIEPDRWYYWCDKLGLLVWQDMPSGNNATPAGQREFEAELLHMVKDLYNHPSVIVWILFNEGWGQYDTQRLTQRLKALDPSRLVDSASGWTDLHTGDLADVHNYPGPAAPQPESRRAAVLGEFGGLGLIVEGHSWSPTRHWGYRMEPDRDALENSYFRLLRQVGSLSEVRGLSAAVFTQTTDVETECNGLLSYDRAVAKLAPADLARANAAIQHPAADEVIVADAMQGPATWSYTFQTPATNWFAPVFAAVDWQKGEAGFGTPQTPGALVKTLWNTSDIWLRREFVLGNQDLQGIKLEVHHDEDAEIFLNGVLAANLPGFVSNYDQFDLFSQALATLKPGLNTLAVHCHQTSGGQYIDVGLVIPRTEKRSPVGSAGSNFHE
jgi:Glycosyl hydrolases family 2, sugar binding domain/Glycosyl hydrolases family 2, TIM barrel domain/Glycosyl hydrolases family 2